MLTSDFIRQEHEMPQNHSYVQKDTLVKSSQSKIIFVVKIGIVEQYTWAMLMRWEVASLQALGDFIDIF